MGYQSTVVSVGTDATVLTLAQGGVVLQNLGSEIVYVGGPEVTADETSTGGLQLPASDTTAVTIPAAQMRRADDALYGRTASGTASVAVLT